MKKIIVFLHLLFLSFSAFGQEQRDSIPKHESRWSLGIKGGTTLTSPTFLFNQENGKGELGYGGGLFIGKKIKKNSDLFVEATFLSMKYEANLSYNTNYKINYGFETGGVHCIYRVSSGKMKFRFGIGLGLGTNILLKNKYEDRNIFLTKSFFHNGSFILSALLSPYVALKISNSITLEIGADSFWGITPFIDEYITIDGKQRKPFYIKTYLFNISLKFSI